MLPWWRLPWTGSSSPARTYCVAALTLLEAIVICPGPKRFRSWAHSSNRPQDPSLLSTTTKRLPKSSISYSGFHQCRRHTLVGRKTRCSIAKLPSERLRDCQEIRARLQCQFADSLGKAVLIQRLLLEAGVEGQVLRRSLGATGGVPLPQPSQIRHRYDRIAYRQRRHIEGFAKLKQCDASQLTTTSSQSIPRLPKARKHHALAQVGFVTTA